MKTNYSDGQNDLKFASATPSLHFKSFINKNKKMTNFVNIKNTLYTQNGILPLTILTACPKKKRNACIP
ncbi:MAG TPA: hypothetical protein PLP65_01525 [Bacteroidales bacterium]|nr:hypothetical protein [Bacteroidales bacterium]